MVDGWDFAMRRRQRPPTEEDIIELAMIVEPRHNGGTGYRTVGVRVGSDVKPRPEEVPEMMTRLVAFLPDPKVMDEPWCPVPFADDWFRQYEEIHPLRDGCE